MAKYKIAWLPGDGVGNDVMEAARIVLDKLNLDAEYTHGDIGWEFWKTEANPLPERTVELLGDRQRVAPVVEGAEDLRLVRAGRLFGFAVLVSFDHRLAQRGRRRSASGRCAHRSRSR